MRIGVNLAPPNYYAPASLFVDRVLIGTAVQVPWGTGKVNAAGWPSCAGAYNFATYLDVKPRDYVAIITQGTASIVSVQAGGQNIRVPIVNGRATFNTSGAVVIGFTVTANDETRWAIVPADEEDRWKADPIAFSPTYLARYKGFRCARMMDWMRTNDNTGSDYAEPDLARPGALAGRLSLSLIVKFLVETGLEGWINIPVLATDDTVRYIMQGVKPLKAAGIKVHVEFSNEVWNLTFKAHNLAIQQEALVPALKAASPDGSRWYGYRAAQISKVIQQSGWTLRRDFEMAIGCFPANPAGAANVWSGVSIAGGSDADFSEWATSSYVNGGVSTDIVKTIALTKANDVNGAFDLIFHGRYGIDWLAANQHPKHKAIADAHKLALVVYEGNTSFYAIPGFDDSVPAMKAAGVTKAQIIAFYTKIVTDPRYEDVTRANLSICEAAGVKLFCAYNDQGRWGENGLFGLYGSPGWDALTKWIAADAPAVDLQALAAKVAEMQRQLALLAGEIAMAVVG
jgi:hypothetical protein